MRPLVARCALWFATAMVLACSGTPGESATHAEPLVVESESGALLVTVSSEPRARPVRGRNRIFYRIELAESGKPVDGLELHMEPFMPSHGHGSARLPLVTPLGEGSYRFDDVVLSMPGIWELHTTIGGPIEDSVAPRFEVE
ncbi:MAG: FixH family protein [Pseudomonadota bacterium]